MKEVKGMKEYEIIIETINPAAAIVILSRRSLKQISRAQKRS